MFQIFAIVLVVYFVFRTSTGGPRLGYWRAWWASAMLLPVWLDMQMGSLKIDLRTIGAVLGLGAIIASPDGKPKGFFKPVISDFIAVVMAGGMILSEKTVGQFGPLTGPEIARLWFLPYLVGRLWLTSEDDIPECIRSFTRIGAFLTVYSMIESVLKFNPINRVLGKTYGLLEQGEGYRMGLKRCQGGLDHPIFYGMMMILLLPWALEASRQSRRTPDKCPKWWSWLPWLWAGALVGSVSRGPQLCGIATTGISIFFNKPKWRLRIVAITIVLGFAVFAAKAAVLQLSATISGEANEETRIIYIDGEEEEYTGTRHRVLLFKVYKEALDTAGLYGHGYQMRSVVLEESLAQRFGSIDSAYILIFLQRGWLGVGSFLSLLFVSLVMLAWMAWPANGPRASLSGSIFGALTTVSLGLFSVWFAPDFGTIWLFTAGLTANLWALPVPTVKEQKERELSSLKRDAGELAPPVLEVRRPQRQLSTGAAPKRPKSAGPAPIDRLPRPQLDDRSSSA